MNEFEIIQHYFADESKVCKDNVALGIGDDAAIVDVPDDALLVMSMDTLVEGIHFPVETKPEDVAYKALAVNISDMAAMAAEPKWITLSLSLPEHNPEWLGAFSQSLKHQLSRYSISLIGGDLCRAPLSVTIQIHGLVAKHQVAGSLALTRSGANPGDSIYVSGELGAAAFALHSLLNETDLHASPEDKTRLYRPEPRLELGLALRELASSCIDISDGLISDLGHILKASRVGARVQLDQIPYAKSLMSLEMNLAQQLALTGGDDYELCFTLPAALDDRKISVLQQHFAITKIGEIIDSNRCVMVDAAGEEINLTGQGYWHF